MKRWRVKSKENPHHWFDIYAPLSLWDRMTGEWEVKLRTAVIVQMCNMQYATKLILKKNIEFMISIDQVGKSEK